MITGETGVGKELIARAIHTLRGREGSFVAVNVAGLDDAMFSDTLFGHKRGAYSGAEYARDGLIVQAAGGTLFLDEIGDLSESSQVKLLRLLQEHTYYPLGSDTPKESHARIIVATNQDIQASIAIFRPLVCLSAGRDATSQGETEKMGRAMYRPVSLPGMRLTTLFLPWQRAKKQTA